MIKRYSTKEMEHVWSEQAKFDAWLNVELLAMQAWQKLGVVPLEDVVKAMENASFDIERIYEIEEETKHDVIAFTRAVSESLEDERKWVHYGLTSTDVVDTANGFIMKQANDLIEDAMIELIKSVEKLAFNYQYTPCIGRTHGIHAEITTFGLKASLWYEELVRDLVRFKAARKNIEIGKVSGAVGTFGNTPPFVQDFVCEQLGIESANISTQVIQRDRHAEYMSALSLAGSTIERIATEIRHLQRTEVNEVREGFSSKQKGSSAMPHKRNPISCENMCGCSRVLRGYMVTSFENINLWHERDISHSSSERIILPDATTLFHYMLKRFKGVIDNLEVDEVQMLNNIYFTNKAVFSGQILNRLVANGLSREQAYDLIQPIALNSYKNKLDFEVLLEKDENVMEHLSQEDLKECFDIKHHLKEVDTIFRRVFTNFK
ncbi:MAG: adenylosuccinate lyase [Erysipelotrichales bacterium]